MNEKGLAHWGLSRQKQTNRSSKERERHTRAQAAEKSTALTYMLNRTAKLHWGLGHKSLKTVYKGAIVPPMTYGAPVWVGAITKHKYLQKLQSAQRLINIKIAKAYRTISF
jgi:hypothetical protein